MKKVEILQELPKHGNVTQSHEVSKCCWKNGANRLAPCWSATNLQFEEEKSSISEAQ